MGKHMKKFALLLSLVGWVAAAPVSSQAGQGFKLMTAVVGEGGNIWLPSTLILEKGEEVKLSLHNLVDKEHGFTIDGLKVKEVIKAKGTKEVTLKPEKAGVFRFYCHLHEGHVGGQILVK